MYLRSSAFMGEDVIPARFGNTSFPGGENLSIPYAYGDLPPHTVSVALAVIDLSPVACDWVHWLVVDLPAADTVLPEGASGVRMPIEAVEMSNSFGTLGYGGPTPPPGTGVHRYEATAYALDIRLDPMCVSSLEAFRSEIIGHVLASATHVGLLGH